MTISTHVLDTSAGRPASAVRITLLKHHASTWIEVLNGETDADGRVALLRDVNAVPGSWRLTFDVGSYFQRSGVESFYTTVAIDFVVRADAHYHVPLLISPFGYSTYRGS